MLMYYYIPSFSLGAPEPLYVFCLQFLMPDCVTQRAVHNALPKIFGFTLLLETSLCFSSLPKV